jgi:ActR/RegA family two-component response regulator
MNHNPRGIRVLLVDDEEIVLQTLAAFMEDWGYEIFTAGDMENALQILRNEDIDIAVVDMRLKNSNGNTMILEAHALKQTLQFIVHTGSASYTIPPDIAVLGVTKRDVFMKPIRNFDALFDAINRKVTK